MSPPGTLLIRAKTPPSVASGARRCLRFGPGRLPSPEYQAPHPAPSGGDDDRPRPRGPALPGRFALLRAGADPGADRRAAALPPPEGQSSTPPSTRSRDRPDRGAAPAGARPPPGTAATRTLRTARRRHRHRAPRRRRRATAGPGRGRRRPSRGAAPRARAARSLLGAHPRPDGPRTRARAGARCQRRAGQRHREPVQPPLLRARHREPDRAPGRRKHHPAAGPRPRRTREHPPSAGRRPDRGRGPRPGGALRRLPVQPRRDRPRLGPGRLRAHQRRG